MKSHLHHKGIGLFVASAALVGTIATQANAQSFTALYDFNGTAGSQVSQPVTSGVPTGVAFGDLVRGSDLKANAGLNGFNSTSTAAGVGFNSTTRDPNGYLGLTITPSAGQMLTLSGIAFTDQRSATGPASFEIRSSLDGFTTTLASYTEAATTSTQSFTFASLTNLTTPITLELFGFAGTGAAGTYRLTSPTAGTGLTVSGTLSSGGGAAATPEPGALALIGAGLLPIGMAVRRRRAAKKAHAA